jgi:hypothetical protein
MTERLNTIIIGNHIVAELTGVIYGNEDKIPMIKK